MWKRQWVALVLSAGFAASAAAAGTGMSSKDQWACEVAMCLSNPAGPMAVSECVAPIRKMLREQAKGRVIPRCKFLAAGSGGAGAGPGDRGNGGRQQAR